MRGQLVRRTWEHDPSLYAPARFRKACHYEAFIPDELAEFSESISSELSGIVSEAEAAIRTLNSVVSPALAPFARLLLRSESIASSKIEGMQVEVREIARAQTQLNTARNVRSVVREVLGNIGAMESAIDRGSAAEEITLENIVDIHRILMKSASTSHLAGLIRKEQNWIGGNDYNPCGADFVPPPQEEVAALMADLCRAMNEDHLPPVIQAGLIHAQFETIHPFHDGNGRTGRALVHVILRRRGMSPVYVPPISIVLAGRKERYVEGLTKFRRGETSEWLSIFSEAAAKSAHLASSYVREVESLQDKWRKSLAAASNPRSDAAAWAIIDILPAYPVITVPVTTVATGRTKAVVGEGLKQLEAAGILSRLPIGGGATTWESAQLLDLISDLEAGEPPSSSE